MAVTCNDCKYCIMQDFGYSNYTVEGTEADCLKNQNQRFPVDNWYGHSEEAKYAFECPMFVEGDPVYVDCDQEDGALENYSDDPEVKELLRAM